MKDSNTSSAMGATRYLHTANQKMIGTVRRNGGTGEQTMKQIKVNPNNEQFYSEEFIRGFNLGAERQYEADIADMPTIDIVHCGECKCVDSKECPMYYMGAGYTDDDFCSFGERID